MWAAGSSGCVHVMSWDSSEERGSPLPRIRGQAAGGWVTGRGEKFRSSMTGLTTIGGPHSVCLSLKLVASSRAGGEKSGQLCGSWAGVFNWAQQEVGRLSSDYFDEND